MAQQNLQQKFAPKSDASPSVGPSSGETHVERGADQSAYDQSAQQTIRSEELELFGREQSNETWVGRGDFILADHMRSPFPQDSDATSLVAHPGSDYGDTMGDNMSVDQEDQRAYSSPRAHLYDAVRDSLQRTANDDGTIPAALNLNEQAHDDRDRIPPSTPFLRPIDLFEYTMERHEILAFRLLHPPCLVLAELARPNRQRRRPRRSRHGRESRRTRRRHA